jgi:starvation-inducible outer membrane lipoprotein
MNKKIKLFASACLLMALAGCASAPQPVREASNLPGGAAGPAASFWHR